MAKDKKKKTAEAKAAKQAKQGKKAAKSEKKIKAKNTDGDSDVDENVDLDAVLAAYAEEQAKYLKVTEQPCSPPTPRSSATFLASPSNRNELFLFGGEYYDGASAYFYNDLFVYQINQGEWKQVTSPNSPLPRSGHAWCRGGNTGGIYLFGGEFSSPKQGTFYHYNDFWHLDPDTREWTRLESKGKNKSPPARSGHRMTYWKNFVVLFGGFQDTSQQTKYLQDTWIYDVRENIWHEFKLQPAAQKPDPRSSFSWLPHESGIVLSGGYSRVKASVNVKSGNQQGKQQRNVAQRNVLKPKLHQDAWFLRISLPPGELPLGTCPNLRWERRKTPANSVNPPRAGITMTYHKGRGVFFGGVHDKEDTEEAIESEFFQGLFVYNIDRNRMFPVALRRPKAGAKTKTNAPRRNRGRADEEELLRNLAALETKGSIDDDRDTTMRNTQADESDDDDKKEYPVKFEFPHSRFNALLTVQEDTVYIYGGTFERKDVEITFSDLYAVDLNKLDGVKELYYVEPVNMNATLEGSEDDEEDDEDDDMDLDEDSDVSETDEVFSPDNRSVASTTITDITSIPETVEVETERLASQDPRPFPRPFESRADFFRRTTNEWQKYMLDYIRDADKLSVKELREKAFQQAEERWWDCREEVQALEDEQEAAGVGDVVSLADRGEGAVGKRR